jgi:cytochrome c-type biogenesis protein CcmH/NrfF
VADVLHGFGALGVFFVVAVEVFAGFFDVVEGFVSRLGQLVVVNALLKIVAELLLSLSLSLLLLLLLLLARLAKKRSSSSSSLFGERSDAMSRA